jgi:hypothetical protein
MGLVAEAAGRMLTALAVIAFMASASATMAQDDVEGIAIAQSPAQGFFACHGGNADRTLACAREKCVEAGGDPCYRVRWCFPAGWAGAMAYLANREVTQTVFLCGAPTGQALVRMLAAQCASLEAYSECRLAVAWSPEGTESEPNTLLGKNTAPVEQPAPAAGAPGADADDQ